MSDWIRALGIRGPTNSTHTYVGSNVTVHVRAHALTRNEGGRERESGRGREGESFLEPVMGNAIYRKGHKTRRYLVLDPANLYVSELRLYLFQDGLVSSVS